MKTHIQTPEALFESNTPEGQVMLKFLYRPGRMDEIVQIWPKTYLLCGDTGHRSPLVWVHGIPLAPQWRFPASPVGHTFILLFTALPRQCRHFNVVEEVPTGTERYIGVTRNRMDVYEIGH